MITGTSKTFQFWNRRLFLKAFFYNISKVKLPQKVAARKQCYGYKPKSKQDNANQRCTYTFSNHILSDVLAKKHFSRNTFIMTVMRKKIVRNRYRFELQSGLLCMRQWSHYVTWRCTRSGANMSDVGWSSS